MLNGRLWGILTYWLKVRDGLLFSDLPGQLVVSVCLRGVASLLVESVRELQVSEKHPKTFWRHSIASLRKILDFEPVSVWLESRTAPVP